jgi:hypothetical protein
MAGHARIVKAVEYRGWRIEARRPGVRGGCTASAVSPDGRHRHRTLRSSGPGAPDRAIRDAMRLVDRIEGRGRGGV